MELKIFKAWLLTIIGGNLVGSLLLFCLDGSLLEGNFTNLPTYFFSGLILSICWIPTLICLIIVAKSHAEKDYKSLMAKLNEAHLAMVAITVFLGNIIVCALTENYFMPIQVGISIGVALLYAACAALSWKFLSRKAS